MTASMAFCYLFWITTLAWVVRYIIGAEVKGGFSILCRSAGKAIVGTDVADREDLIRLLQDAQGHTEQCQSAATWNS
jgi:hypothetical protein